MHKDETLAEEFARLTNEYHTGDEHTKPEAWNLLADFAVDNASAISAALSALVEEKPVAVKALEQAYAAGFEASSDGYNAEYFPEYETNEEWLAERSGSIDRIRSALVDVPAVESEPVGWTSVEQIEDTQKFALGYFYAEGRKPDNASIPLYASPVRSALAPAPAGEDVVDMPADLVQRCEEVLEWDQAGILQDGGELRALAGRIRAKFGDALSEGEALSHAEEGSKREAMRLIVALSRKPSNAQTVGVCPTCNGSGKEGRHQLCRDFDDAQTVGDGSTSDATGTEGGDA